MPEERWRVRLEDMELEMPSSLREILIDEIHATNYDDFQAGRPIKRLDDDTIKGLLKNIYAHIERQALEVYHSNEPWALKAWAYSNILKDAVVASEETDGMISELIFPMQKWQNSDFDPMHYYREALVRERRSARTSEAYLQTAARFVAKMGRKTTYSDEEVNEYLTWASKKYPTNTSSYHHECTRLLQFLRRLPGGKGRDLPFRVPRVPRESYQPLYSKEEIESLIWCCLLESLDTDMIARLLVATIYGARVGEAAALTSKHIYLDGKESCITLPTEKEGERKPQPVPVYLVPIFAAALEVGLEPVTSQRLLTEFKRVCKLANVRYQYKGGFHAIRRQVVTTIAEFEHSDINIHRFMRWSEPRQFTILATYKKNPSKDTDQQILDNHPFALEWKLMAPYLIHNLVNSGVFSGVLNNSSALNNHPDKSPNSFDSDGHPSDTKILDNIRYA